MALRLVVPVESAPIPKYDVVYEDGNVVTVEVEFGMVFGGEGILSDDDRREVLRFHYKCDPSVWGG